ncbi:MAG: Gfo/Idh/MocA family oxidoreductase, partial [Acidobacteria bacterium]|nr:Gfo/Idh/MocA family oxidoreductase [Acidobacteriota bacterium]
MPDRRVFLSAATGGLTTNIFPALARGANDKVRAGFIGMGRMGMGNMGAAMRQENLEVAAVCDVYQPNLEKAAAAAKGAKAIKDFREILADKSIDIVCISTPDHWHAYMTVEACKAGKDVYVEKPISVTIEEGQFMVKAARKYNRVVQAGTWQRSQPHYQQLAKLLADGAIGDVS